MRKDITFVTAGIAALLLARLTTNPILFWLSIALGISSIIGGLLLRAESKKRRAEVAVDIQPQDWTVEEAQGMAIRAWVNIPKDSHNKGNDIIVRIEQLEITNRDFDQPQIDDGNITIRYASNNFPMNPRLRLKVHIAGRG